MRWDYLEELPIEEQTYEICLEHMKKYGYSFHKVKEEFKTYELCIEAVKRDGNNLRYVKDEYHTPEMILTAIKAYGENLQYVKKNMITLELSSIAIEKNHNNLVILYYHKMFDLCKYFYDRGYYIQNTWWDEILRIYEFDFDPVKWFEKELKTRKLLELL